MESGGPSPLPSFPVSRTSTPSDLNPDAPRRTKIAVYCGSSAGKNPVHLQMARDLARVMAANNIALVYGGGTVGLMGELAKTLVSLSGPDSVHGIIPEALVRYERDPHYTSTHVVGGDGDRADHEDLEGAQALAVPEVKRYGKTTVVKDMHTRKQMMAKEVMAAGPGSGFIALSGGFGTIEELAEIITWNQLGLHNRGIVVLNINGFYNGILDWIRKSTDEGFIKGDNGSILVEATNAEDAIKALREYKVSSSVLKLAWGNE